MNQQSLAVQITSLLGLGNLTDLPKGDLDSDAEVLVVETPRSESVAKKVVKPETEVNVEVPSKKEVSQPESTNVEVSKPRFKRDEKISSGYVEITIPTKAEVKKKSFWRRKELVKWSALHWGQRVGKIFVNHFGYGECTSWKPGHKEVVYVEIRLKTGKDGRKHRLVNFHPTHVDIATSSLSFRKPFKKGQDPDKRQKEAVVLTTL